MSPEAAVGKKRYGAVDTLRGVCVIGMVLYHALFFTVSAFGLLDRAVEGWGFRRTVNVYLAVSLVRDLGAALFILISGFCFFFCRRRLKRILILGGAGAVITAGSFVIGTPVVFGILSFMCAASVVACALEKLLVKLPAAVFAVACLALFLVFLSVNYGYVGYGGEMEWDPPLMIVRFPEWLYANVFTAMIGFPPRDFESWDYYSLIPWIFAYFCGFFTYRAVSAKPFFEKLMSLKIAFLAFLGRHSLAAYLIHVPVVAGAAYGIKFLVER